MFLGALFFVRNAVSRRGRGAELTVVVLVVTVMMMIIIGLMMVV